MSSQSRFSLTVEILTIYLLTINPIEIPMEGQIYAEREECNSNFHDSYSAYTFTVTILTLPLPHASKTQI